jgi:hypothetical protein
MVPIVTALSRHRPKAQHRGVDFRPSDIARFENPTAQLNDVCMNDSATLLQSHFNTPYSDVIAIISTLALPTSEDGYLWRIARHSMYWEKDLWLVPLHRTAPYEHWVLCVLDFPRRQIGHFDSLADQSLWEQDVKVGCCYLYQRIR